MKKHLIFAGGFIVGTVAGLFYGVPAGIRLAEQQVPEDEVIAPNFNLITDDAVALFEEKYAEQTAAAELDLESIAQETAIGETLGADGAMDDSPEGKNE